MPEPIESVLSPQEPVLCEGCGVQTSYWHRWPGGDREPLDLCFPCSDMKRDLSLYRTAGEAADILN